MSSRFLLLVENGGGGIWWGFLKDIWSWKTLTSAKARTGLKDHHLSGALHSTAQHSSATDRPTDDQSQGLSEDITDLETQPPLLTSEMATESPWALCASYLPSFLFRSLYAPQYFVGKAATYQHQQSSARVGNGSVRPRGWAPKHPPMCLQSTDPAIKGEGRGEYLPPPTASKPPNGSGQSNPFAFIKSVTRHSLWLIFFLSHVRAEEWNLWTGRRTHLAGISPLMGRSGGGSHTTLTWVYHQLPQNYLIYTCIRHTRSLWVTAIKQAWYSKMILHRLHVERAKTDGKSTRENMVWRKTKNREAHLSSLSTV